MEREPQRNLKLEIFSGILVLACIIGGLWLFPSGNNPDSKISINSSISFQPAETAGKISEESGYIFYGIYGNITINTTLPEIPSSIPVYKKHFEVGDRFSKNFGDSWLPRKNVTSEEDASEVAKKIMEQYGGLPSDAIFDRSHTEYLEYQKNGETTRKEPIVTTVSYSRNINGMPSSGDVDQINLELGENGSLVNIYKSWSHLSDAGDVPIISAKKATEKLQRSDIINSWMGSQNDVSIEKITLGYHEFSEEGSITEPVWYFFGFTTDGEPVTFEIYARQFANFTATPATGTVYLNVTFIDTSDASPKKWLWDFGDGTNSTVQNPVHVYPAPGTYNVTLTAWNDLGSDTVTKPCVVKPAL